MDLGACRPGELVCPSADTEAQGQARVPCWWHSCGRPRDAPGFLGERQPEALRLLSELSGEISQKVNLVLNRFLNRFPRGGGRSACHLSVPLRPGWHFRERLPFPVSPPPAPLPLPGMTRNDPRSWLLFNKSRPREGREWPVLGIFFRPPLNSVSVLQTRGLTLTSSGVSGHGHISSCIPAGMRGPFLHPWHLSVSCGDRAPPSWRELLARPHPLSPAGAQDSPAPTGASRL